MKSAQAQSQSDKDRYSDLQVMKSAAGYYVGTSYRDDIGNAPGTRDSDYFRTQAAAETYLSRMKQAGGEEAIISQSPERQPTDRKAARDARVQMEQQRINSMARHGNKQEPKRGPKR